MRSYAYEYASELIPKINRTIIGHVCMTDAELQALAVVIVEAGHGDHLEIGTMWGGTAILAASMKEYFGLQGTVFVIDPFYDSDGEWGKPNSQIFWENARRMSVAHRLDLIEKPSFPFPIVGQRFSTALIDGNHRDPWPERDWNSVKEIADIVIFHDTNEAPVKNVVDSIGKKPVLFAERLSAFKVKG